MEQLQSIDNRGKNILKIICFIVVVLILVFVGCLFKKLWYYGTFNVGSIYINAWMPKSNNEPYFHMGFSTRERALDELIDSEKGISPTSSPSTAKQSHLNYEIPYISFKSPSGWMMGQDLMSDIVMKKGTNYCVDPSTYECYDCDICNPGEKPDHAEIRISKESFCEWTANYPQRFVSGDLGKCDDYKIEDFIKNASVILPENGLDKDIGCGPYSIHNKAVVKEIGKYQVVEQESGSSCTYQNGDTTLTYYFYLPEFRPNDLIIVSFDYYKNNSNNYLMEFNNLLKTIDIGDKEYY